MKNYLSFGGGVNSVAMMLLFEELEMEYEAIYAHVPDWPETHEYIMYLEYIGYKFTVIHTTKRHWSENNLYGECLIYKMLPAGRQRWCTINYKIKPLNDYFKKPCFVNIGIAYDEIKRAKFYYIDGEERRFPLIEYEITRKGCIDLIKRHGLKVPIKSGCWFCPFQSRSQWMELRRKHPDLFCKALKLEELTGRNLPISNKSLRIIVNEADRFIFDEMSYPPCECGL